MPPRVCAFFEHEDSVHAGGGESVNLNFSHDTASRYVGLYRNRENPRLRNLRNLAEAYQLLWRKEDAAWRREQKRAEHEAFVAEFSLSGLAPKTDTAGPLIVNWL